MDTNLVEIWLRKDPTRWFAGIVAGLFAGLVMLGFSMVLSAVLGGEFWMPVKYAAIPFLGGRALEYGFHADAILLGLAVTEAIAAFFGFVYAHFTGTNSKPALLGVGLAWGAFSWIFLFNLYTPSFREVYAVRVPPGAAFFSCMVYGLALTSVAFFDRTFRRRGA